MVINIAARLEIINRKGARKYRGRFKETFPLRLSGFAVKNVEDLLYDKALLALITLSFRLSSSPIF